MYINNFVVVNHAITIKTEKISHGYNNSKKFFLHGLKDRTLDFVTVRNHLFKKNIYFFFLS